MIAETLTFHEYLAKVQYAIQLNPDWREGQAYFNTLYQWRSDISETIRSTLIDPFYSDDKIPAFLEEVSKQWSPKSAEA